METTSKRHDTDGVKLAARGNADVASSVCIFTQSNSMDCQVWTPWQSRARDRLPRVPRGARWAEHVQGPALQRSGPSSISTPQAESESGECSRGVCFGGSGIPYTMMLVITSFRLPPAE